jgi:hypothetical protein
MLRPEGSFVSGDPADYPDWDRILLEVKRVEKRGVSDLSQNGSENPDSTA